MQASELAQEIRGTWIWSDPAESERRFATLLSRLVADPEAAAIVRTQIARALGLQRRFDEGHALLDAVEREPAARGARVAVRVALERGRLFNSAKEPERARPYFEAALERATAAGEDALAVDAAHMIAIVEPGAEGQAAWNEKAIALSAASTDPVARGWLASLTNNLGWVRHGEGRFDEALRLFEAALAARLEDGSPGGVRIARWCVARTLRSLGRFGEALAAQGALEQECAAAGEPDGFVFEEIGECLLALGRAEEARPAWARAHELLSQDAMLAAHEPERLARLRRLADGGADAG